MTCKLNMPRKCDSQRRVDDLAILVRRLAHQLPDENPTKIKALDYLKRIGREGSPLRED